MSDMEYIDFLKNDSRQTKKIIEWESKQYVFKIRLKKDTVFKLEIYHHP